MGLSCGSSLVEEDFGGFTVAIQIQYVQKAKSNTPVPHMYVPILGLVLNPFANNKNLEHLAFDGKALSILKMALFKFCCLSIIS